MAVDAPARFNPFSAAFRRDPYPAYRALRETRPVHKTMGMWVLTRHADVTAVLRDRTFSASLIPELVSRQATRGSTADADSVRRISRLGEKSLVFTDNPEHARLRGLVNRVFTAEAIAGLRPSVETTAARLVDQALRRGGMDAMADFAAPLPLTVMCDWMALPPALRERAGGWTHDIRFLLEPGLMSALDFDRVAAVVREFTTALADLVAERRTRPGPDLISRLAGVVTGSGDRLGDEEAAFVAIMCFVAGNETTKSLIGNGLLALLRHPEQLARLAAAPGLLNPGLLNPGLLNPGLLNPGLLNPGLIDTALIDTAVGEALRYDSPLQMTKRLATRDTEIGGTLVPAGDQVLLCLGAANRDPAVFARPDEFDVGRDSTGHLAFGYGMHGCLGGALARLQAEVAFGSLLRRTAALELAAAPAELEWQDHSFIVRGLNRLPVSLRGAA